MLGRPLSAKSKWHAWPQYCINMAVPRNVIAYTVREICKSQNALDSEIYRQHFCLGVGEAVAETRIGSILPQVAKLRSGSRSFSHSPGLLFSPFPGPKMCS